MRVDIKQWGTTLVRKNLSALPKVQEFLTSVGCFLYVYKKNLLQTVSENLGTTGKIFFLIYMKIWLYTYVHVKFMFN